MILPITAAGSDDRPKVLRAFSNVCPSAEVPRSKELVSKIHKYKELADAFNLPFKRQLQNNLESFLFT